MIPVFFLNKFPSSVTSQKFRGDRFSAQIYIHLELQCYGQFFNMYPEHLTSTSYSGTTTKLFSRKCLVEDPVKFAKGEKSDIEINIPWFRQLCNRFRP